MNDDYQGNNSKQEKGEQRSQKMTNGSVADLSVW
jgi:hypothetical protein